MGPRVMVIAFVLFFGICGVTESGSTIKKRPTLDDARLEYLTQWNKIADLYQNDDKTRQAINYANWYQRELAKGSFDDTDQRPPALDIPGIPIECDPSHGVSGSPPSSVHALRPGDITVVGAFGDSITAGNGLGAATALNVVTQNRGEAFSVGGDFSLDSNVTTIPNMLRQFNPNVKGHSDCSSSAEDFDYSWFNVAVPGARAVHLPGQADDLVTKMKNDERIDFQRDWKMVTLFIGGNDFCSYCNDREDRTPEIFKGHIQDTLDKLHQEVPRVFVNLVPMAHVGMIQNVTFHHNDTDYPEDPDPEWAYPWACDLFHQVFCPCVLNATTRDEVGHIQQEYFRVMKELVDSRRYDTKDDFTVVLQPHLKDQEPLIDPLTGLTDNRYFAPDCFHPNRRMHQLFAYLLWNVMLTPVGEKPHSAVPEDWPTYVCPSEENPFLFTHINSNPEPPVPGDASRHIGAVTSVITMVTAALMTSRS